MSGWTTSHLAEEHGEPGPARLRAEVLVLASKLSFHQLLGGGGTEGAHTTVLPPKLLQVQVIQQLTAWGEEEECLSLEELTKKLTKWTGQVNSPVRRHTVFCRAFPTVFAHGT